MAIIIPELRRVPKLIVPERSRPFGRSELREARGLIVPESRLMSIGPLDAQFITNPGPIWTPGAAFSLPYDDEGRSLNRFLRVTRVDAGLFQLLQFYFDHFVTADAELRVAMYMWHLLRLSDQSEFSGGTAGDTDPDPVALTDSFIAAARRARDTRVIIDDHFRDPALLDLFDSEGVPYQEATGPCGHMHNKFVLIGGGGAKTVIQLSANIRTSQYSQANDAIVLNQAGAVYDAYVDVFDEMWDAPGQSRSVVIDAKEGFAKCYSFPRATGDPVASILERVRDYNPLPSWGDQGGFVDAAIVQVAAYFLRRSAVIDALISLHEIGSDVLVLVSNEDENGRAVSRLVGAGVPVRVLPTNVQEDIRGRMHCKYITIHADYPIDDVVDRRSMVLTGSHNYTTAALRDNDEMMLRLDSPEIYLQYHEHWNDMRSRAHRVTDDEVADWETRYEMQLEREAEEAEAGG
ncbi:MAG: phospholipase D-like domain-containing protein [Myxococcota bacterium]